MRRVTRLLVVSTILVSGAVIGTGASPNTVQLSDNGVVWICAPPWLEEARLGPAAL